MVAKRYRSIALQGREETDRYIEVLEVSVAGRIDDDVVSACTTYGARGGEEEGDGEERSEFIW